MTDFKRVPSFIGPHAKRVSPGGALLAFLFLAALPAVASTRELIEQALDEPTRITLENIKLGEAAAQISRQTGVRIVLPADTLEYVPHGAETEIHQIDIAGVPLREGLQKLFAPLGMEFVVGEDHVEILPKPALRCLGRPPTWEELDTLAELSSAALGLDANALEALRSRIQFQVPVPGAWQLLSQTVRNVGAGSGEEVLTVACRQLGWGWCLDGKKIVVTPLQEQIVRRLQQPITLRTQNRPLLEVLKAIGEEVNVSMRMEPSAPADLPLAVQRSFSLNAYQQPAEEVLETIAAYTGVGYFIEPDSIVFYNVASRQHFGSNAEAPQGSTPAPTARDPYVAKLAVTLPDGLTVEWLIRQSELPEDLRERRQRDIARMIEAARRGPTVP